MAWPVITNGLDYSGALYLEPQFTRIPWYATPWLIGLLRIHPPQFWLFIYGPFSYLTGRSIVNILSLWQVNRFACRGGIK